MGYKEDKDFVKKFCKFLQFTHEWEGGMLIALNFGEPYQDNVIDGSIQHRLTSKELEESMNRFLGYDGRNKIKITDEMIRK